MDKSSGNVCVRGRKHEVVIVVTDGPGRKGTLIFRGWKHDALFNQEVCMAANRDKPSATIVSGPDRALFVEGLRAAANMIEARAK